MLGKKIMSSIVKLTIDRLYRCRYAALVRSASLNTTCRHPPLANTMPISVLVLVQSHRYNSLIDSHHRLLRNSFCPPAPNATPIVSSHLASSHCLDFPPRFMPSFARLSFVLISTLCCAVSVPTELPCRTMPHPISRLLPHLPPLPLAGTACAHEITT